VKDVGLAGFIDLPLVSGCGECDCSLQRTHTNRIRGPRISWKNRDGDRNV
jgi:hypothetical protein